MVLSLDLDTSSAENFGLTTASAIRLITCVEYLERVLAPAPSEEKLRYAPKKSIFLLNSSLLSLVVPVPSWSAMISPTPTIFPS